MLTLEEILTDYEATVVNMAEPVAPKAGFINVRIEENGFIYVNEKLIKNIGAEHLKHSAKYVGMLRKNLGSGIEFCDKKTATLCYVFDMTKTGETKPERTNTSADYQRKRRLRKKLTDQIAEELKDLPADHRAVILKAQMPMLEEAINTTPIKEKHMVTEKMIKADEDRQAERRKAVLALNGFKPKRITQALNDWLLDNQDRIERSIDKLQVVEGVPERETATHKAEGAIGKEYIGDTQHYVIVVRKELGFKYEDDVRFVCCDSYSIGGDTYWCAVFDMNRKAEICVCCGQYVAEDKGKKKRETRPSGVKSLAEFIKDNKHMILTETNIPDYCLGAIKGGELWLKAKDLKTSGVDYRSDKRWVENKVKRIGTETAQCAVFKLGG